MFGFKIARVDAVERRQIAMDIEREPMERDSPLDRDADGRYFPALNPDAREALDPAGIEIEFIERRDQRVLDQAQVADGRKFSAIEIDDRISDQLSRAVIGDISSSLDDMVRVR